MAVAFKAAGTAKVLTTVASNVTWPVYATGDLALYNFRRSHFRDASENILKKGFRAFSLR